MIPIGVHALPEPVVLIDGELSLCRETFERFTFEHAVAVGAQIVEELAPEDKEAAVDQTRMVPLSGRLVDPAAA